MKKISKKQKEAIKNRTKALVSMNCLPEDGEYLGGSLWVAYYSLGYNAWKVKQLVDILSPWNISDSPCMTFILEENAIDYCIEGNSQLVI